MRRLLSLAARRPRPAFAGSPFGLSLSKPCASALRRCEGQASTIALRTDLGCGPQRSTGRVAAAPRSGSVPGSVPVSTAASLTAEAPSASRRSALAALALALPAAAPWLAALPFAARAQPVPAVPRRIVCVGGALTEIIWLLGAGRELVGVDTTSLHPAEARALPSVGYARALSAEGVLSLTPNLLLATRDAGPPAVVQQLKAARVAMHVVEIAHSLEGVRAAVRQVAMLVGREAQGERLAAQLAADGAAAERHVAALAGRRASRAAPRVLFVLSHSMAQVRIAGRQTAADAVLTLAGGANAFADVNGYKPLTPEAAVAAAPDIILTTDQGLNAAGGIDGLLKAPGLAATPAGRARRVVSLDALLLLGFGPRLPQAVAQLADRLHAAA
jgi:iron complex transport system substrate-binding protein